MQRIGPYSSLRHSRSPPINEIYWFHWIVRFNLCKVLIPWHWSNALKCLPSYFGTPDWMGTSSLRIRTLRPRSLNDCLRSRNRSMSRSPISRRVRRRSWFKPNEGVSWVNPIDCWRSKMITCTSHPITSRSLMVVTTTTAMIITVLTSHSVVPAEKSLVIISVRSSIVSLDLRVALNWSSWGTRVRRGMTSKQKMLRVPPKSFVTLKVWKRCIIVQGLEKHGGYRETGTLKDTQTGEKEKEEQMVKQRGDSPNLVFFFFIPCHPPSPCLFLWGSIN